jgi:hypothetical protein
LKRSFEQNAAKANSEPDPVTVILCCERTQREKCGMSEKLHAVARREKQTLVRPAAWIRLRIYKSRTKKTFAVPELMAAIHSKACTFQPPKHVKFVGFQSSY